MYHTCIHEHVSEFKKCMDLWTVLYGKSQVAHIAALQDPRFSLFAFLLTKLIIYRYFNVHVWLVDL